MVAAHPHLCAVGDCRAAGAGGIDRTARSVLTNIRSMYHRYTFYRGVPARPHAVVGPDTCIRLARRRRHALAERDSLSARCLPGYLYSDGHRLAIPVGVPARPGSMVGADTRLCLIEHRGHDTVGRTRDSQRFSGSRLRHVRYRHSFLRCLHPQSKAMVAAHPRGDHGRNRIVLPDGRGFPIRLPCGGDSGGVVDPYTQLHPERSYGR